MKNVTRSERIFIIVSYILLGLLAVVTIVPLLSVLITSFVSASEIARRGQFILWPEVWDTSAYGILFKTDKLYTGYANTLFVVIVGTALSMFLTITLAYPLSKRELRGRNGILGSHITFGDQRRGWNFVSPGHGNVDFDNIIRALNQIGYTGPLSIEWEDSGMERVFGGTEACEFTKKINFSPSNVAFDDAMKTD